MGVSRGGWIAKRKTRAVFFFFTRTVRINFREGTKEISRFLERRWVRGDALVGILYRVFSPDVLRNAFQSSGNRRHEKSLTSTHIPREGRCENHGYWRFVFSVPTNLKKFDDYSCFSSVPQRRGGDA